ncbi:jasmonate O-methyltransferase-like [Fagus crenata]
MEVKQVLHMNKGTGETSYAKNSRVQSNIISITNPVTEEALLDLLCKKFPESLGIADLGCSSGPNTLSVISEIIDVIYAKCSDLGISTPELKISLNDLYSNDFNDIFGSLPAFYKKLEEEKGVGFGQCFISGVPGSFYGRLFPSKSIHFVHSSSSLHWLSQVPPELDSKASTAINKGRIYISKTSPQSVLDSYLLQFQKDFSLFLKSRSEEIVPGGRMVLSFMGRRSMDPTTVESIHQWELLAQALMNMVSEGLVLEEKVDTFNAPYYGPCAEELELEIQKEGSFIMDRLEAVEVDWDGGVDMSNTTETVTVSSGQRVAKAIRAVVESMLESHFGRDIMDDLFRRHVELVDKHLAKTRTKYISLVIYLIRKG